MKSKVKRECPSCGCVYDADPVRLRHGRQKTCSRACSYKARANQLKRGQEVQCGGCGDLVWCTPSRVKRPRHGEIFCSPACAYANRKRVVESPYILVSDYDRAAAAEKAWETRRTNPKPYPESARSKARARAIERLKRGGSVSRFEREAAEVYRALGYALQTSVPIRRGDGTYATVFDIVVPSRRVVIECHGTFWHGGRWTWDHPKAVQVKNLRYEARKVALARSAGLDLRLLWEHDFKRDPVGACLTAAR